MSQLTAKTNSNSLFYKTSVSSVDKISEAAVKAFAPLPHDTCLDKKFSVVFYIIQDSLYTLPSNVPPGDPQNTLTTYSLAAVIARLNQTFARICVSFENCKVVIIPNYSYNKWTMDITDPVVTASWYTEQTLNIYIPTEIKSSSPTDTYAYASAFPTPAAPNPKDYIVVQKSLLLAPNSASFNGDMLLHALGHFFGLPHTFQELSLPALPNAPSLELVNGSNSATTGDRFTDTEADPWPTLFDAGSPSSPICGYRYKPGLADAQGNYYTPPTDNFMSVYLCRCRFTQEQYNYMAHIILTKRLYLH